MVYLGYAYRIEVSVVDHIIEHPQFNPKLLNNNGANAFVIAALNKAPFEVFVSLLTNGCDINCVSGSGGTTMSWCLERKYDSDVIKWLLRNNFDTSLIT